MRSLHGSELHCQTQTVNLHVYNTEGKATVSGENEASNYSTLLDDAIPGINSVSHWHINRQADCQAKGVRR